MSKPFDVDAAIEAIADRVHQGWMNEKLAQGFADHPFAFVSRRVQKEGFVDYLVDCSTCIKAGTFKPEALHHSDMLPYAELPEYIKNYDRKTARMVFEWLTENGWQVVAKEEV